MDFGRRADRKEERPIFRLEEEEWENGEEIDDRRGKTRQVRAATADGSGNRVCCRVKKEIYINRGGKIREKIKMEFRSHART